MKKELSAGIIFLSEDKTKIFMGRATNVFPEKWDIPKGHVEKGESPLQAALRECLEETDHGIQDDDEINLVDLGLFKYSSNKDLYLFRYKGLDLPVVSQCTCTAYHTNEFGHTYPEFDKFAWVDLDELHYRTGPSLGSVLQQVLKQEILDYYGGEATEQDIIDWKNGTPIDENSCSACHI